MTAEYNRLAVLSPLQTEQSLPGIRIRGYSRVAEALQYLMHRDPAVVVLDIDGVLKPPFNEFTPEKWFDWLGIMKNSGDAHDYYICTNRRPANSRFPSRISIESRYYDVFGDNRVFGTGYNLLRHKFKTDEGAVIMGNALLHQSSEKLELGGLVVVGDRLDVDYPFAQKLDRQLNLGGKTTFIKLPEHKLLRVPILKNFIP